MAKNHSRLGRLLRSVTCDKSAHLTPVIKFGCIRQREAHLSDLVRVILVCFKVIHARTWEVCGARVLYKVVLMSWDMAHHDNVFELNGAASVVPTNLNLCVDASMPSSARVILWDIPIPSVIRGVSFWSEWGGHKTDTNSTPRLCHTTVVAIYLCCTLAFQSLLVSLEYSQGWRRGDASESRPLSLALCWRAHYVKVFFAEPLVL